MTVNADLCNEMQQQMVRTERLGRVQQTQGVQIKRVWDTLGSFANQLRAGAVRAELGINKAPVWLPLTTVVAGFGIAYGGYKIAWDSIPCSGDPEFLNYIECGIRHICVDSSATWTSAITHNIPLISAAVATVAAGWIVLGFGHRYLDTIDGKREEKYLTQLSDKDRELRKSRKEWGKKLTTFTKTVEVGLATAGERIGELTRTVTGQNDQLESVQRENEKLKNQLAAEKKARKDLQNRYDTELNKEDHGKRNSSWWWWGKKA